MKIKLLLIIGIFFSLTACVTEVSPTVDRADESASFRVALLLPRTIDADGWNRSGYDGLRLIESELGAEIAYSEAVPEDEFEQVFRQYAEEGYDFIIGHGGQFVEAAEIVAEEFPRTRFAVTAVYEGNNRNLGSFSFNMSEVAYLAGVIATLKTESDHVAMLSGAKNLTNEELAESFERGVKATNPDIEVSKVWTGSWTDEDAARETMQQLIDNDADVITVIGGQVATLIHQIAEEAGVYTIGWSIDQYDVAPNSVLVSVIENPEIMFLEGATLVRRGQWQGKQYLFGLPENALTLTSFRNSLTPEQEEYVEEVKEAILSGAIRTIP